MNDNGIGVLPSPIEASISKPSDANNILGDTEKETLEGYVEKLKEGFETILKDIYYGIYI